LELSEEENPNLLRVASFSITSSFDGGLHLSRFLMVFLEEREKDYERLVF
jgi:hypothetical protein